jgi:hypothetical protein
MRITGRKSTLNLKKDPAQAKVISISPKYSIYQFIYILIQILCLLFSALFLTTVFYSEIPEIEVPLVTLYYDPAKRLDLNNLPTITYSVNIVATVKKKNVIPVPISVEAKVNNNNIKNYY